MRPRPRLRQSLKWSGAAIVLCLLLLWAPSGWVSVGWSSPSGWILSAHRGTITLTHITGIGKPPSTFIGYGPWRSYSSMRWAARWIPSVNGWSLAIPIWMFATPAAAISFAAWRFDTLIRRRERLNLCPKCGYDRIGLARHAKCPECGSTPP